MSSTPSAFTVQVQGAPAAVLRLDPPSGAKPQPTPILFLHGWGVSSDLMKPLAERMAALGYTGIIPDFPGFGDTPPPPTAWAVRDYARWTLDVMNAMQVARAHLFAHSFGARVSLFLASASADRFDKVALTGAAGIPTPKPLVARLRLHLYKSFRSGLRRIGADGLSRQLGDWYSRRYGSADYQAASGIMRETFLKVVNEDLRPVAAQVSRPTLLFWGALDQDTPLWQGKALEKLIPDAGLIVYDDDDHYAYLRRHTEITRTLDHFYRH
ncbi:MAG: alpha/beta hydrolase [Anaerolineae bacterium]|nr:alpha/beta hydrolase [Anaerolineae bacterium]